ncbi:hypothetical protein J6E39_05295 [bacterium]|nr:hypothetical protein [bacterium]
MKIDFLDRFINENNRDSFWTLKRTIGVLFAVLFLCLVMINTTGCTDKGDTENSTDEISVDVQPDNANAPDGQVTVGNDGVKAGLAGDNVTIDDMDMSSEKMVAVNLEDAGRADPFLPYNEALEQVKSQRNVKIYNGILPPVETLASPSAAIEKILTTKVSGIMYDNYNPSAILNIDGVDYLVRSGDKVDNYKVLSISKSVVTVQSGSNVYKAGVGQLLTYDNINNSNIVNLENKFGGAKNRSY